MSNGVDMCTQLQVVDDKSVSMISCPGTCVFDLTMSDTQETKTPDPAAAISTDALRESDPTDESNKDMQSQEMQLKDDPVKDVVIKKEPRDHSKERKRDMQDRPVTSKKSKA